MSIPRDDKSVVEKSRVLPFGMSDIASFLSGCSTLELIIDIGKFLSCDVSNHSTVSILLQNMIACDVGTILCKSNHVSNVCSTVSISVQTCDIISRITSVFLNNSCSGFFRNSDLQ